MAVTVWGGCTFVETASRSLLRSSPLIEQWLFELGRFVVAISWYEARAVRRGFTQFGTG